MILVVKHGYTSYLKNLKPLLHSKTLEAVLKRKQVSPLSAYELIVEVNLLHKSLMITAKKMA